MKLYYVNIFAENLKQLRALERFGLDLRERRATKESENRYSVPGILNADQIATVKGSGYQVETISDISNVAPERTKTLKQTAEKLKPRLISDTGQRLNVGYLEADEVETAMKMLTRTYPEVSRLIELPEKTWEGRISHAIKLHAGDLEDRPALLVTGSMHAREWGGSDICMRYVNNLLKAYTNNEDLAFGGTRFTANQIRTTMENLDIIVFPDVNPDGKHHSQNYDPQSGESPGFWWRKNRNPNDTDDTRNMGVDLNRNFDFLWSSGIGTSGSLGDMIYKGKAAFSEPETRNIMHLLDTNPNIRYYVDVHCFSGLILYSWGDAPNQGTDPDQNFLNPAYDGKRGDPDFDYGEYLPDDDQELMISLSNRMKDAIKGVRGQSYKVQQSVGLYPTSATSDDYILSRHIKNPGLPKIYGFTIEFGTEEEVETNGLFVPPFPVMRLIIDDVCAALTELSRAVSGATATARSEAEKAITG